MKNLFNPITENVYQWAGFDPTTISTYYGFYRSTLLVYPVLFSGKCNGTIEVPTFLCIHSLVHYHDHDVTKSSIFSINPALFIIFLT